MVAPSDAFLAGWMLGILVMLITGWLFVFPKDNGYKTLLREIKYLVENNNGLVTPTDLVLRAEISPNKSKKFLKKLAQQLEATVEVDETGTIYYRFTIAKAINSKLLKG